MRDRDLIIGALALFLVLMTFPVWYNLAAGTTPQRPEVERPAEAKACVAPVEYMRASHMKLLIEWRDRVVRQQERQFVAFDGTAYAMSLTQTCLRCHTNKAKFCDRCHESAGVVRLPCWQCHVDPAQTQRKLVLRSGE